MALTAYEGVTPLTDKELHSKIEDLFRIIEYKGVYEVEFKYNDKWALNDISNKHLTVDNLGEDDKRREYLLAGVFDKLEDAKEGRDIRVKDTFEHNLKERAQALAYEHKENNKKVVDLKIVSSLKIR